MAKPNITETLSSWKDKVAEKWRALSMPPYDAHEANLQELVDRTTSELLIAPDWSLNFEVVDAVNQDHFGGADKVARCLRRNLNKHNVKVQLLTLTVIETCVKNCNYFHQVLLDSDLWRDMLAAGQDRTRRWDPEVRDKILSLVEDFAKGLKDPRYKEAYEDLLDAGVDFPVRPEEAVAVPLVTPPSRYEGTESLGALSQEDKAAIEAAMAQMDEEDRSRRGVPGPAGFEPPAAAAARGRAANGRAAGGVQRLPPLQTAEQVQEGIQVARNSVGVLADMLASIPPSEPSAIQDGTLAEVAQQCYSYRSLIQDAVPRILDDGLVSEALTVNDELQRVLGHYQDLLATATAAAGGSRSRSPPATLLQPPRQPQLGAGGGGSGLGGAAPNFSLLGDDDELSEEPLQTRRTGYTAAKPSTSVPVPLLRPPPADSNRSSGGGAAVNLISLSDSPRNGDTSAGSSFAKLPVEQEGLNDLNGAAPPAPATAVHSSYIAPAASELYQPPPPPPESIDEAVSETEHLMLRHQLSG